MPGIKAVINSKSSVLIAKDVKVTKDVYDYARKYGKVQYKDLGKIKDIPLDTSTWEDKEDASLTHTLPF